MKRKQIESDGDERPSGKAAQLSFLRGGRYGDWKTYLPENCKDFVWRTMGADMEGWGYKWD